MKKTLSVIMMTTFIITAITAISSATFAAETIFIEKGQSKQVQTEGVAWKTSGSKLVCGGMGNFLIAGKGIGKGDFTIRARLSIDRLHGTAASLVFGGNHFGFDGSGNSFFVEGPALGKTRLLGNNNKLIKPGQPFDAEITRRDTTITFSINGKAIHSGKYKLATVFAIAFRPWRATMRLSDFSAEGNMVPVTGTLIDTVQADHKKSGRPKSKPGRVDKRQLASLRMAVEDLSLSYPEKYKGGDDFLSRLDRITETDAFIALKREVMLANPLLNFEKLLIIRRRIGRNAAKFDGGMWGFNSKSLGIPDTGSGNTILPRKGFDNEIAALSPVGHDGQIKTIYKPQEKVFVGDVDLHWDGEKMLFSSFNAKERWQIFEVNISGRDLRQVTPGKHDDVDNYDACYLPDDSIIFGSTRSFQRVPCRSTMQTPITLMFRMDADGSSIRQLTFDQDHNWCPAVLPNGRVMYLRWEYSGIPHGASRILFQMNPDGTGQTAYYGSNSHWPNCIFFARAIPGNPGMFTGVVSGNHDVPRMGEMILFDRNRSTFEADGVVQRIPGHGRNVVPIIADTIARNSWPKFLHPWPLSDKYFITACKPTPKSLWGIYLVDVFDNMLLLREEPGNALLEPIPLRKTARPPVIPDRVDLKRKDATVFLADVYMGKGLTGVPRGAVKKLRLFTYHFQYINMLPKIRNSVGGDGPWEPLRVLGTVPVASDGSASFRIPANTPISIQPLDENGAALQLMRSWFTAMPGENISCVGCHESHSDAPPAALPATANRTVSDITPWYGPTRGFSFDREVQPVLQKYCIGCHDGKPLSDHKHAFDLRRVKDSAVEGKYSPAYMKLYPYTRTPSLESDMHMLIPGDFHADNSELIQMLRKGHYGVKLSAEAWDRIITWIDLSVPFYGTWHELAGVKHVEHSGKRRREMRKLYANIDKDPESITESKPDPVPIIPKTGIVTTKPPTVEGWPFDATEAKRRQSDVPKAQREILMGDGVKLVLVYIPAGRFIMGDAQGCGDERPLSAVTIDKPFWMGRFEVTNQQFAQFDPQHNSRWFKGPGQQYSDAERGWRLNGPQQPVVRVSWQRAMAFCQWLSNKTGETFTLPTETQWEYACRAGTDTPLWYGGVDRDFSKLASVADPTLNKTLAALRKKSLIRTTDALMKIYRPAFSNKGNDSAIVTASVGRYQPSPWGLCDIHGNAAEWTLSTYKPYPYLANDGRDDPKTEGNKVVRGGSFHDRPATCRSSYRLSYPSWRRVFNVGFRVICRN